MASRCDWRRHGPERWCMPKSLVEGESPREADVDPPRMRTAPLPLSEPEAPYHLQQTTLDQAGEPLLAELQALHDLHSPDLPMTDPEWVKGDYLSSEIGSLSVYSLHQRGKLRGAAAVARRE